MSTNPNMEAIETITVGATSVANITFSNIPQGYTDLKLVYSTRDDRGGTQNGVNISLNGSTSNFTNTGMQGSGSATASFNIPRFVAYSSASSSTANTFANNEIYFPNYTSSNNKSFSSESANENNATTAYILIGAHLWSNSAAITTITLTPDTANFVQYSSATLYGVTNAAVGAKATGGIISETDTHWIHTFTASGTFTPSQNLTADYLVVAGGGGGGQDDNGGGGGAGGLRSTVTATGGGGSLETALSLTAGTSYTATVGAGGANTTSGNNSVFSTITSTGGGNGNSQNTNAGSGGSGGGGGTAGNRNTAGTGTANQGFAGGTVSSPNNPAYGSGGGGGAGAVGVNATTTTGGSGGVGVAVAISGSSVTYAGGGGGGVDTGYAAGTGGTGGGGAGGSNVAGTAGTANTGGGGGGSGGNPGVAGGAGGSGIVIVRYAK